jgi:hypothetical protein
MRPQRTRSHDRRNDVASDELYCVPNGDTGVRISALRIGAIAFATLPAMTPAFAGDPLPGEDVTRLPVRDRPRPDYDPVGWRYGAIFFHPWLLTEMRYNSNVYARPTDPQADLLAVFSPRLTVRSDSPRLSWKAELGADVYRYRRLTGENRTDAHARVRAHGEIHHDLDFDASFQAAQRHEMRGDPSAPLNAASPVPFVDIRGEGALTKHFGPAGITAGGGARSLTYGTVATIGGAPLDQSWRDATIVTAFARPFYELAPGYRAFLYGGVNSREYQGRAGVNLDSRGYNARGGLDFVVTSLISGTIEAGWLAQSFSDRRIGDVDGLSFAGKLSWLLTPLTTVSLRGERLLAERTSPEFPARIDAFATAQVDHELLRNVLLYAGVRRGRQDFPGTPRQDEVVNAFGGVDYLPNRFLRLGVRYEFTDRASTLPQYNFDQHQVMLNATAQF